MYARDMRWLHFENARGRAFDVGGRIAFVVVRLHVLRKHRAKP